MTLTKAILADMLFKKVGLSKREARDIMGGFFDVIADSLAEGTHVKIAGFGKFEVRDKKERPGRNPKTLEPIPISARRVVVFHASRKIRGKVMRIGQKNG